MGRAYSAPFVVASFACWGGGREGFLCRFFARGWQNVENVPILPIFSFHGLLFTYSNALY
jgi:hypothetical protein